MLHDGGHAYEGESRIIVELNDIRAAAERIRGNVRRTPVVESTNLLSGAGEGYRLALKLELLQGHGLVQGARAFPTLGFSTPPQLISKSTVPAPDSGTFSPQDQLPSTARTIGWQRTTQIGDLLPPPHAILLVGQMSALGPQADGLFRGRIRGFDR